MRDLSLTRLQDYPGVRQLGLLIGLAGAIAVGLWIFSWSQQPSFKPVYAGMDEKDSAEVASALQTAGIEYRLDPSTGAVTVPDSRIHEARMKLAAAGLPAGNQDGMEMIQGDQGFGVSQFVEGARYQHALEVELERTISTLRPVKAARIHLALPKASAFTRQGDAASASVLLELQAGQVLDANQVAAVVHLVASSIPSLRADKVTVIDQTGRMLSNPEPNSQAAINNEHFDQVQRVQGAMVDRVQRLLAPLTGPGRVSTQVSVDMDFAVSEEATETYNSDPQKVRSEQISQQGGSEAANNSSAVGVPGAASNTPGGADATAKAAAAATTSAANKDASTTSRNETRNYELDRKVSHVMEPGGKIRRVSVAVLVDHIPVAAAAGTAPANTPALRALSADELKRIEALVKEAVGFDSKRGDSVSIMNATFAPADQDLVPASTPFWQQPILMQLVRLLLGAVVVLLLVFRVLRPTLRTLMTPSVLPAPLPRPEPTLLSLSAPNPVQDVYEAKLAIAREVAGQDPRRVAQVVKGWVGNDA